MSTQPQAVFPFSASEADPTSTPLSLVGSESCEKREKSELTLISPISHFSHEIPEPKLSDEAFYGPVGSIVQKIEPLTEAHPAPILLQTLIGLGNIIGRDPYFMTNSTAHRTNLYGITVGRSGSARKGTAWESSKRILSTIDPSWASSNIRSGLGSGEGVISALQDTGDTAVDAIADKRLLLREGEFAQVLQAMKRGGSSVSTVIRNGWDGGSLATVTKRPMIATNCHISMMCDVTREELAYLGKREQTNGFSNRCLWCFSKMPRLLPLAKPIDLKTIQRELDQIRDAVKRVRQRAGQEMVRSAKADEYWSVIYEGLVCRPEGVWGEVTQRASAQVVRLSMIYALLDGKDVIDLKHMIAAKALWDYCDQSARWAFEGRAYGENAQRILNALQYGELTQTDLHNLFQRHISKLMINQALKEISHLIEVVTEKTTGRNKTSYILKR